MNALPVVPGVSIRLIQQIVCERYGVDPAVMSSLSRKRDDAWPRQMAMALCREYTAKSLCTIGRHFGGRDHTTVINACRAVPRRTLHDLTTAENWRFLRAFLDQLCPRPVPVDDLYAELELEPGASPDEIKAAHRSKVKACHPDLGGDKARFQALNGAYKRLMEMAA